MLLPAIGEECSEVLRAAKNMRMEIDLNVGQINGGSSIRRYSSQFDVRTLLVKAQDDVSGGDVVESSGDRRADGEDRVGGCTAEDGRFMRRFG